MQNYVAQKKLKLQNNEIQKEIILKSEQIKEYENKIIKEIIYSINKLLEIHDPYTKGHSQHVADIARKISIKMNLSEKEIKIAYWSGLLHDIGKLLIPLEILNKKSSLSNKEYELVKKHPYNGYQVLNGSKSLTEIAKNVLYHHERWDGKGYPEGIKGENIPLISQIITVADAWDAMRSSRAYRAPLSKRKAIKEIKKNKGKQFSPEIVDIFLLILRNTEKCQEEY